MKRGRKSLVSLEEQKKALCEFKKYFANKNDIPSPCDPVFEEISQLLSCRMSTKVLYVSMKKNYDFFFDCADSDTFAEYNIKDSGDEEILTKAPCCSKKFEFSIDIYQWDKIKPITQSSKRTKGTLSDFRYRKILPKHQWADMLREEIWKKDRGECSWIFRNYSITFENNVTCFGSCKQCHAQIEIKIYWPTDKIVRCICNVHDIKQNFKHDLMQRKIKLSPGKHCELSKELKYESAVTVRNRLANITMDSGDCEPSHLPTVGALRQIKYESRKSTY